MSCMKYCKRVLKPVLAEGEEDECDFLGSEVLHSMESAKSSWELDTNKIPLLISRAKKNFENLCGQERSLRRTRKVVLCVGFALL